MTNGDAADIKLGVSHLIVDHDTKFAAAFDAVLAADGVAVKRVGPRAPNLNAFAERWVQSLRQGRPATRNLHGR